MIRLLARIGVAIALASIPLSQSQAVPITGWLIDPLAANTNSGLTGADTASPVWGTAIPAGSTNNSAIWASFPTATMVNNRLLTLTATVQLVGSVSSAQEQFRFGLLGNNGSANTAGWLGFLGQNSAGAFAGELSAKNPAGQAFSTTSWVSILGTPPRATPIVATTDPEQDQFSTGTYQLSLSVRREASDVLKVSGSIVGMTFSDNWFVTDVTDSTLRTYDYNRVGFFAGVALNADQIKLSNVDVTLIDITPGDTNGDDLVDSVDYANIFSHFNQMVTSRLQGDLNGDGIVDLSDFHEWKANQTSGAGQSSIDGSVVPEPASWALAAVGAILLVLQRQRHLRHLARCSLC